MAKALEAALALHADYPNNRESLAGKRGPAPEAKSPELLPALKDKYGPSLDYEGNVVKSCIHCHQIGDAQRSLYRSQGKRIPESVLFPAPHPLVVGLTLDPKEKARVHAVEPGSAAEQAGFVPGDDIVSLAGQPLISIADVQWVLHRTSGEGAEVPAEVLRDGGTVELTLRLESGWKRAGDISWRASAWELRRMVTGGLLLKEMSADERAAAGISSTGVALKVEHVGEYGEHAAAKKAGVKKGDILTSYDGRTDLLRDSDVLAYGVTELKPGESVKITVLRSGEPREFLLPIQQ
jgi:S1-C subfamily serine protease